MTHEERAARSERALDDCTAALTKRAEASERRVERLRETLLEIANRGYAGASWVARQALLADPQEGGPDGR